MAVFLTLFYRDITCDECFGGLQAGVDQLLEEETIQAIIGAMSGDAFCGMEEDAERCARVIETLIPLAVPALILNSQLTGQAAGYMICNNAIPDTCPAL